MKITVKWEVDDGYVGKSRPQKTIIDTEDMMDDDEWNELSPEDKINNIESLVQEDFEQRITFSINDYGI